MAGQVEDELSEEKLCQSCLAREESGDTLFTTHTGFTEGVQYSLVNNVWHGRIQGGGLWGCNPPLFCYAQRR